MTKINRFEEIEAWQKSRQLTARIYEITQTGAFNRDYGLRDQIRRASVSVMSSIAEGFERGGNKEFYQFLAIAKGSVGEVRSQLYIAHDVGYLKQKEFEEAILMAEGVGSLIGGFMRYLKKSELRGVKYKEEN